MPAWYRSRSASHESELMHQYPSVVQCLPGVSFLDTDDLPRLQQHLIGQHNVHDRRFPLIIR